MALNDLYKDRIVDVIKTAKFLEVKDDTYDVIKKQEGASPVSSSTENDISGAMVFPAR